MKPFLVCAAVLFALTLPSSASAAGELAIVSPLRVETPKGLYTGQPLRFSFTVRNQTTESVAAEAISVLVRSSLDPAGPLGATCTGGADLTIPAGGTFACVMALERGYADAATYTAWADWLSATDGTWHRGELGPDETFVLDPPPVTTLATEPQVSYAFVPLGGASLATLTITNTGAAVLLIDAGITLTGTHASEFALLDESCTQGPVAPGAVCQLVVRFAPQGPELRAAVLGFTSNAGAGAIALSGIGLPPPTSSDPEQLRMTLSFSVRAGSVSTRFTSLTVKNVPSGATVQVYCARGCSRRLMLSRRFPTVSLKTFVRKPLRVRTRMIVRVTRPGAFGIEKVLTVRARRRPAIATYCLNLVNRRVSCVR